MTATKASSLALLFVLLPMTCWGQIYGAASGADNHTGMSHFPGGCLWETYCCERESICEKYYRSLSHLHKFGNFHGIGDACQCPHGTGSTAAHQCTCSAHVPPTSVRLPPANVAAPAATAGHAATGVVEADKANQPELAPRISDDTSVIEPPTETVPSEPNVPPVPAAVPSLELPKNPLPTFPALPTNELPTTGHRPVFPVQSVGVKLRVNTVRRSRSLATDLAVPQPSKDAGRSRSQARSLRRWRAQSLSNE